ncbi:pilin [Nocardia anaemiae]|uniref:pilin n=1 Tax=Nocardia anaemiae TaxID=263910 RepID=UPI001FE01296
MLAAGTAAATPPQPPVLAIASSLDQVLDNLRNWLIGILAALATVCLTVAGARYLIGAGDPAEMEKAKSAFRAACLGYALAMLAPLIVAVLQSIVGA